MGPIKTKGARSFLGKHKEKHEKQPSGATWWMNDILNQK